MDACSKRGGNCRGELVWSLLRSASPGRRSTGWHHPSPRSETPPEASGYAAHGDKASDGGDYSALGFVTFEVPADSRIAKVQFAMNSGFSAHTGQWKVTTR